MYHDDYWCQFMSGVSLAFGGEVDVCWDCCLVDVLVGHSKGLSCFHDYWFCKPIVVLYPEAVCRRLLSKRLCCRGRWGQSIWAMDFPGPCRNPAAAILPLELPLRGKRNARCTIDSEQDLHAFEMTTGLLKRMDSPIYRQLSRHSGPLSSTSRTALCKYRTFTA